MTLENKNGKKRFKLFDSQRVGKGVSKNQAKLEPGLKRFFVIYKNNLGKLVSVNIFFILGNFPIFFLIATLAGVTQNNAYLPLSDVFQNLSGVFSADGGMTPYKLTLYSLEGLQAHTYVPTALTYVFYGIGALFLFTFGIVNVGTAYIIRNMVSGEPVFVWTDFWYAVKRNWKQALPFSVIDALITGLLVYNIYSLITSTGGFLGSMMFWSNIVIFIVYFFMRYYIYVQMVTFKLSVFKMLKNSLIFSLLGIKRNFLAFLGILLIVLFEIMLLFGTGGLLLPLAIGLPLIIMMSTFAYIKVYASYYTIKEVMIDPYAENHPPLENPYGDEEDEIIMRDDVTEKERLEEIKRRNGIQ